MSSPGDSPLEAPAWTFDWSAPALAQAASWWAGIDPSMIALVFATLFVTAMLKGMVGLGLSTGSVAVLATLYGVETAITILVLPTLATNLWQGAAGKHLRALVRRFAWTLALIPVGVWAGHTFVISRGAQHMEQALGLILVAYAGVGLLGLRWRVGAGAERTLSAPVGALNGLVAGVSGVLIMPAALYIEALALEREQAVQLMALVFTLGSVTLGVVTFGHERHVAEVFPLSVTGVAPALAGTMLGNWLGGALPRAVFRRLLLAVLGCIGLKLLIDT